MTPFFAPVFLDIGGTPGQTRSPKGNTDMSDKTNKSRRKFLELATVGMGAGVALVVSVPVGKFLLFPVGKRVVTSPTDPIYVIESGKLVAGGAPVKVQLVGEGVRNAWLVSDKVALGSAWLRRQEDGKLVAMSSVCPHLGCAIGYQGSNNKFLCPCHNSEFAVDGKKLSGPAKRGLDSLPTEEKDGGVWITFKRFRQDIAEKVEA